MKKTKIIITICMVAVLMMTLCVSTFASGNVLQGEEGFIGVDTNNIIGTWVFNNDLVFTAEYSFTLTFTTNAVTRSKITVNLDTDTNNYVMKYFRTSVHSDVVYTQATNSWASNSWKTIEITEYNEEQKDDILEFLNTYATKTAPVFNDPSSVGILDVANEIPSFLTTGLTTVTALFYTDGELTFVGYLAIASLAISVCFLIISIIRNFLHFRG